MALNQNLVIGYNNWLSGAGVIALADQQDANFPAENVITDARDLVWKTTDGSAGHWIMFDLLTARSVDLAITFDLNVLAADLDVTFFYTNNGALWGDPTAVGWLLESAELKRLNTTAGAPARPHRSAAHWFSSPVTARYWAVFYSSSVGGGDSVLSTGKVFIGQALAFPNNYTAPIPFAPDDYTVDTYSPYGVSNRKRRCERMRGTFAIPLNTRTQQTSLDTVFDSIGTHTPGPFLFDNANYGRWAFWAKFTRPPAYQHVEGDLYSYTFDWREVT